MWLWSCVALGLVGLVAVGGLASAWFPAGADEHVPVLTIGRGTDLAAARAAGLVTDVDGMSLRLNALGGGLMRIDRAFLVTVPEGQGPLRLTGGADQASDDAMRVTWRAWSADQAPHADTDSVVCAVWPSGTAPADACGMGIWHVQLEVDARKVRGGPVGGWFAFVPA